ncbi:TetR/AcrR family transcriptional regulator [Alkalicoccobacillus gibsonii]|uniref:TetR/AcrR family transcriptional regulator n=1 Tax=Alkalicoccobacillus gibsonii TaxID=79881 RepID=UPI0019346C6B|nr:TetR-like C-terminal domain-containing protein [Alkalicoccobacillus gibsonii]MBM0065536.1 TetR/AcrR family transcriptional regulator C-terminal domain-containing protein [Alkalicoccobacillus gibsonii]
MNEKIDRRKRYTRHALKEALVGLLKEKSISSITVKELCEMADINRSTFYGHYTDPYDLLEKISEEVVDDMYKTLNQYNFNEEEEALQMTEKILEYAAEKSDLCQVLLSGSADTTFKRQVMELTQRIIMKDYMKIMNVQEEISSYLPLLVLSGSIDAIENWLVHGQQESPKEMALLIHRFTNYGLMGFVRNESGKGYSGSN